MLKTFRSHPQTWLQAQKGVLRLGLQAQPLTSEHRLIKKHTFIFGSFGSHPHFQLDLEAEVWTLEHIFVKTYCQE